MQHHYECFSHQEMSFLNESMQMKWVLMTSPENSKHPPPSFSTGLGISFLWVRWVTVPHGPIKTNIAYMFVLNEAGSQLGLWEFSKIGRVDGMRVSDVMLIEIWRFAELASPCCLRLSQKSGIQALCGPADSDVLRADHCILQGEVPQTCSQ